jgi:hypothetical protein
VTGVSSVARREVTAEAGAEKEEEHLFVQDEVWRVVSEASEGNASIALTQQAQRIARKFPRSGLSEQHIKDALVFAAVDGGVALEIAPAIRADVPFIEVSSLIRAAGRLRRRKGGRRKQPMMDAALTASA